MNEECKRTTKEWALDNAKLYENLLKEHHELIDEQLKQSEWLLKLQQENTQLKRMLNIKEKFDKKEVPYEWEFKDMFDMREENDTLKQQLKDKDEKISKVIEYCNEKLKWNRDDGNDYWAGKNNAQQQVSSDIKDILESNKED